MTLYEWMARLWKPDTVSGVVIDVRPPADRRDLVGMDLTGHAIRMVVAMDDAQAQIWCVPKDTWPNGWVSIVILSHATVADAEVIGHMGVDYAIYDTDEVRIDGSRYNLPPSIWVSKLNPNPGIALKPLVHAWTGEYRMGKTRRTVQFTTSEIKAIRRLEP